MSATKTNHLPTLRFPEFFGPWKIGTLGSFVKRANSPVAVEPDTVYREIGVRSHGKGIFHKEPITGKSLGNKRVFWVHPRAFVVNIVFGWEQAVALTSAAEEGFIASHRFPMFVPVENKTDLNFLLRFFLRKRGKYLLELASPGGAGRNKTLGQSEFAQLDVTLPSLPEQKKITAFLDAVDGKIAALRQQHELLQAYKRGMMRKIFSQELRFKADGGTEFPEWEEKRLGEIAAFSKGQGVAKEDIVSYGIPCIRYGELYTTYSEVITKVESCIKESSSNYVTGQFNDVLIPSSGETALDISTASCLNVADVAIGGDINIVRGDFDGIFLAYYLKSFKRMDIARLAQGISVVHLYGSQLKSLKLKLPCSKEQQKIADFLSAIDAKIDAVSTQTEKMQTFKQGLLQQMFA